MTETIVKTDRLGRVKVSAETREEMLDAFESGSDSAASFAQKHGVNRQTFASWIQKRRRTRGDYENEEVRRKLRMGKRKDQKIPSQNMFGLVEVEVKPPRESAPLSKGLKVILSGSVEVEVSSAEQLPLLKTLIRELSC